MVCYLAPFTQKVRQAAFSKWLRKVREVGIPLTFDMGFNSTFADSLSVKSWLSNGLPNESFSIQNAIILDLSTLQPILIDP